MKRNKILALILCIVLALSLTAVALADAGSFSGDNDWGGGGSDWGSSDWDNDSGDTFIFGGIGGGGDGDGLGLGEIIAVIAIVIVISVVASKFNKGKGGRAVPVAPARSADLTALKTKDPKFSEQAFVEMCGNLYIHMQGAWQNRDWEPMRMHMTDSLYNQMKGQLDMLISSKRTNYIDRPAVLQTTITNYRVDDTNDVLTVRILARIVDYTVDDTTGQVVSGSKTAEKFLTYDWTLIRSKNMVTPENVAGGTLMNCPNCGAALDVNHTAKCEYCGSVLRANEYDWVLSSVKGISQVTK